MAGGISNGGRVVERAALPLILALLLIAAGPAAAQVVAIGASNTAGFGVSRGEAYPAQLEAMLRGLGHDVQVVNGGISGDTSAGMLARLGSSVPAGTRVVVLDPGNNDLKACSEPWRPQRCVTPAERAATIAAIGSALRSRGIKVLAANVEFRLVPPAGWQADRRHLTPEGHRLIASRLAPQVAAALGRPGRG
ncbi:MAG TPA: GDSL-type esterase/lipase family protein [Beijerinckiaceae bacterium]